MEAQKKAKNKMVVMMVVVELKQTKKKLDDKAAEMAKTEEAAYDASMTKTSESLTA